MLLCDYSNEVQLSLNKTVGPLRLQWLISRKGEDKES